MLPPVGAAASNVTLWRIAKDHVTVPPGVMVTLDGSNLWSAVADTFAEAPGGVTVTVTFAVCVTEPIVPVAVISEEPAVTPVTTPPLLTVATPGVPDTNVSVAPDIAAP